MKKIFAIAAAALILAAPAANAQGLLGKLKEKAGEVVSSGIGERISEKVSNATAKLGEKVGEATGIDMSGNSNKNGINVVSATDMVQPRHSSSFCWTEAVTPSAAKFPVPLLKEFPAIPSAAELANPTEEAQAAYYRAIKAVTLRAEELNSSTTCADEMAELWREDYEKALVAALGLTQEELKAIENDTLTPEQEEAIQARMVSSLMGGKSMEELEKMANDAQPMNEQDMMNSTYNATCAVYDKYPKEIKKYMGVTADELKEQMRKNMEADEATQRKMEKELNAKVDAYQKQQASLDKNFEKEAKAFGDKLQSEIIAAVSTATPGVGLALDMLKGMKKTQEALTPLMERQKKLEKYAEDVLAAWPVMVGSVRDMGLVEQKKLEDLRAKIFASNNPAEYDQLYAQADEIIKNYRQKVAQSWANDVQKRYNKVVEAMPNLVQIQRQAVEDQLIPECALWRTPLNLVIEAGDLLQSAYADFPINYPVMFQEEVVRQVKLADGEQPWWPEFYIGSDNLNEILAGKTIFKADGQGNYYQFNAGKWTPVAKNFGYAQKTGKAEARNQTWTSNDGKRTVKLDAQHGQQLFLPEGDIITDFAAVEKQGNDIVWARIGSKVEDGVTYYTITKCVYKL